jgi:hypothetical protein
MEYVVAQKLKDSWDKKPCEHTHFEKEYYAGAFLINWVCTQCGHEFTISQKLELEEERNKLLKGIR